MTQSHFFKTQILRSDPLTLRKLYCACLLFLFLNPNLKPSDFFKSFY
ncbi:hypothetical protein MTR67_001706 [Solanum verrucosum]|uniref:Uncharacterized protein n=1 Tax=Solanum verrucosum TaxID=315347 RepID=A0AAF0PT95_SOLVR|nr:hypothetical protein MTR67_001706 [Solanum verrucosum]